jgi:hypothetical protein
MKKETFFYSIEAIKAQFEYQEKVYQGMKLAGYAGEIKQNKIESALLRILQEETQDDYIERIGCTAIEYFIFDMQFGDVKKENSPFQDVEGLWKFLNWKE